MVCLHRYCAKCIEQYLRAKVPGRWVAATARAVGQTFSQLKVCIVMSEVEDSNAAAE
jgi:hypothetical protein